MFEVVGAHKRYDEALGRRKMSQEACALEGEEKKVEEGLGIFDVSLMALILVLLPSFLILHPKLLMIRPPLSQTPPTSLGTKLINPWSHSVANSTQLKMCLMSLTKNSFPCAAATSSSPPVQEIFFVLVGPLPINSISDRPSSPLPSVGPSLQQQSLSHVYYVATPLDSFISQVLYHVAQPYSAYFCSTEPCHTLHKLACCSTTFSTIHRLAYLFFNAGTTSSYWSLQPNSYLLLLWHLQTQPEISVQLLCSLSNSTSSHSRG
ncbi:unnamed protein product [Prunus brigantina]